MKVLQVVEHPVTYHLRNSFEFVGLHNEFGKAMNDIQINATRDFRKLKAFR